MFVCIGYGKCKQPTLNVHKQMLMVTLQKRLYTNLFMSGLLGRACDRSLKKNDATLTVRQTILIISVMCC